MSNVERWRTVAGAEVGRHESASRGGGATQVEKFAVGGSELGPQQGDLRVAVLLLGGQLRGQRPEDRVTAGVDVCLAIGLSTAHARGVRTEPFDPMPQLGIVVQEVDRDVPCAGDGAEGDVLPVDAEMPDRLIGVADCSFLLSGGCFL